MKIKWLGHSCFKMKGSDGIRILTDPFDDNVGYKLPSVETEIVTVSHNHYDHNFIDCVLGNYEVLKTEGNFNIRGIKVSGVRTYHDNEQGAKRGENIVFKFEIDGINVCHLGDLGHVLDQEQINQLGKIDILLIPVGGFYTIDIDDAIRVTEQLNPKIIIPMHYKTEAINMNIENADEFVSRFKIVEKTNSTVVEINASDLSSEKKVILLSYK